MVPIQILRAALLGIACVIVLPGCAAEGGRRSTGQYTDDVAVTARVREALIRAPGLRSNTIQVETYRGTVQLRASPTTKTAPRTPSRPRARCPA
ncbi:hypothetical protein WJ967_14180 [Achromobacter xylosoxidans]